MNTLMVNGLGPNGHAGVVARRTGNRNLLGQTIQWGAFGPCQFALAAAMEKEISFVFNSLGYFRLGGGWLARYLLNGDRAQKNAHLQIQPPLGASP